MDLCSNLGLSLSLLSCLYHVALCSAGFLALLYVMFSCIFVTFPYGILGQMWYLIVLIPDLCLLLYLEYACTCIQMIENRGCIPLISIYTVFNN